MSQVEFKGEASMKSGCRFTERGVEIYDTAKGEWEPIASAYEWVNKRTKPAKPKDNTMCRYRVKTRQLRSFDIGDIVEKRNNSYWLVTDNKNHCISLPKEMVENSRWFEPVDQVQESEYRITNEEYVYRVQKVHGNKVLINPINGSVGYHITKETCLGDRKLSTPEIEQALKDEAKRRGFEDGTVYDPSGLNPCYSDRNKIKARGEKWQYDTYDDRLHINGYGVYEKGNWAEIVDQTPTIEINGYEAEYFDEYVKWGCAEVDKELFLVLDNLNDRYEYGKNVTSVTIGKGTFTMEQISQIADYYKDKEKIAGESKTIRGTAEFSDNWLFGND